MKIWGEIPKIPGVNNKYKNVKSIEKPSAPESKKDIVSISGQARDLQSVQKALKGVPDIRKDKVDALFNAYDAGNYNVSGKDVADRIISSVFDKKA